MHRRLQRTVPSHDYNVDHGGGLTNFEGNFEKTTKIRMPSEDGQVKAIPEL